MTETLAPALAPPRAGASKPIAAYGLLSDCNSAALVARDGSVDWLCMPRFDSPAVFAAILDPEAGHWSIRPAGAFEASAATPTARSCWRRRSRPRPAASALRDALVFPEGQRGHDLGMRRAARAVALVEGSRAGRARHGARAAAGVRARAPALPEDRGRRPHVRRPQPDRRARRRAGRDRGQRRCVRRSLSRRATAGFSLRWAPFDARRAPSPRHRARSPRGSTTSSRRGARGRPSTRSTRARTASSCASAPASSRASPTGRPARSSPRRPRRFPRPTAASATGTTATPGSATPASRSRRCTSARAPTRPSEFVSFMTSSAGGGAGDEHRCRSCTGSAATTTSPSASCRTCAAGATRHPSGSATAPGARRSSTSTASCWTRSHLYQEQLGELHPEIQRFVADLADTAARRWHETDAGMWEMRGEPRHHLSSKVLCWVALDRAVKLAPLLGEHAKADEWLAERDRIRDAILDARLEREEAGLCPVVRLATSSMPRSS